MEAFHWVKRATVVRELGAALFISVALTLLWDLAGKRAFSDEILAKANMSRDLADAGVELISDTFQTDRVNWSDLFKNACKLDIFVAYAHTYPRGDSDAICK
jgi:hypothetical protein